MSSPSTPRSQRSVLAPVLVIGFWGVLIAFMIYSLSKERARDLSDPPVWSSLTELNPAFAELFFETFTEQRRALRDSAALTAGASGQPEQDSCIAGKYLVVEEAAGGLLEIPSYQRSYSVVGVAERSSEVQAVAVVEKERFTERTYVLGGPGIHPVKVGYYSLTVTVIGLDSGEITARRFFEPEVEPSVRVPLGATGERSSAPTERALDWVSALYGTSKCS